MLTHQFYKKDWKVFSDLFPIWNILFSMLDTNRAYSHRQPQRWLTSCTGEKPKPRNTLHNSKIEIPMSIINLYMQYTYVFLLFSYLTWPSMWKPWPFLSETIYLDFHDTILPSPPPLFWPEFYFQWFLLKMCVLRICLSPSIPRYSPSLPLVCQ